MMILDALAVVGGLYRCTLLSLSVGRLVSASRPLASRVCSCEATESTHNLHNLGEGFASHQIIFVFIFLLFFGVFVP